jgi:hypothetical protein
MSSASKIRELLDALIADFPRRKKLIEAEMKKYGIERSVELVIEPPEAVTEIPTFAARDRRVSPMLKARFDHSGGWNYAGEEWLAASAMRRRIRTEDVQSYHAALRENWEGSAPRLFPDGQLSLYGVTEGVPDNLTYLVWTKEEGEPEVWRYAGLDSHQFKDMAAFLSWFLEKS